MGRFIFIGLMLVLMSACHARREADVVVTINAADTCYLGHVATPCSRLGEVISSQHPAAEVTVMVRFSDHVGYQSVWAVCQGLKRAGINHIGVAREGVQVVRDR